MTVPPPPDARFAKRVIRLMMRSYSAGFRREFGPGVEYSLIQEYQRSKRSGPWSVAWFWIVTALNTPRHAVLERVEAWRAAASGRREGSGTTRSGRGMMMERTVREVNLGLRRLARRPLFSATAVGTVALGIGATSSIFSVIDAVLLAPLPYPSEDRVVLVGHRSPTGVLGMPDGGYLYYADHSTTLEHVAAYIESSQPIAGAGEPLELGLIQATPSLFETLGVSTVIGRALTENDAAPGADPVGVVSHGYWERHLGADPTAIGRPVREGSRVVVVGVMPEGFDFPRAEATVVFGNRFDGPDVYLPLRIDPSSARFGNFMYQAIGRLAEGVTPEQAEEELDALMLRAAETYTGSVTGPGFSPAELSARGYRARVLTVRAATVGEIGRVLWILFAAVGVLLLIAAGNVANLFVVRADSRRGEITLQRALGADRGSLVRSALVESTLLTFSGAILGLALAAGLARAVVRLAPGDVPGLDQVGVDLSVIGFTSALAAALSLGLSLVTLAHLDRADGVAALGGARGGSSSRDRRSVQDVLVAAQVGLALVLMVGSGLLLRTFENLRQVEPGFEPSHVVSLRLSLGEGLVRGAGYDDGPDDAVRSRFMIDLVGRLAELPGVEAAAYTADLPFDGDERYDFVAAEGAMPRDLTNATRALRVFIGPDYLATVGADIVAGRELEAVEFAEQPRSVVVNRAFAEQRWPDDSPLGKRILQYWPGVDVSQDVWYTVVGVVEDIREVSLVVPPDPTVYLPTVFLPEGGFGMPVSNFVALVRTAGMPETVIPSIRDAIAAFHPEIPITDVATLSELTARSYADVTFTMVLLLIAGSLSAILGLVGVYGTVAYVVGQRTREFGLRVALGATTTELRWSVLARAARVGAVGVALGVVASAGAGRLLDSMLYGVSGVDPEVIGGVSVGLLVAVVGASLFPAYRASSVDPVVAMRAE